MTKILIIQGAGLESRGKVQIEVFGTATLADYNAAAQAAAKELGLEVEIVHTTTEADAVARLQDAAKHGVAAAIINPGSFTRGHAAIVEAIAKAPFPTVEVHISNPAARNVASDVAKACKSTIAGFGVGGYRLALGGLKELLTKA